MLGTTPHAPCLPSPLASSSHGLASRQFSASSSRPRACQQHKPNSMAPIVCGLVQPQMQQLRASLAGSSRPRAGGKVQPTSGTYAHLRRHSCRWLRLWRHSPGLEHQGGEATILLTNLGELGGRHRLRSMPEGTALRRGMVRKPAGRLGIGATGHPTASLVPRPLPPGKGSGDFRRSNKMAAYWNVNAPIRLQNSSFLT